MKNFVYIQPKGIPLEELKEGKEYLYVQVSTNSGGIFVTQSIKARLFEIGDVVLSCMELKSFETFYPLVKDFNSYDNKYYCLFRNLV